jgi:hypothetical protein
MKWKCCKWCGLWIRPGKDIYCKMCKEYFDAHPECIVSHGKIVIKKIGE